jgi:phosphoglycerol transferase MdoB-like AlkP superfamily enzyme
MREVQEHQSIKWVRTRLSRLLGHPRLQKLPRLLWPLFALGCSAHVAANWASILEMGIPLQHGWLFRSIAQLSDEVYLLNFAFGISVFLFFRIGFSRWLSLVFSITCSLGFAAISLAKVRHLGVPLLPWDIWFLSDLTTLASFISMDLVVYAVIVLAMVVLTFIAVRAWGIPIRRRENYAAGLVFGIGAILLWTTAVASGQLNRISEAGIHNITWDQKANLVNYGPFYTFVANLQFLPLSPPTEELLQKANRIDEQLTRDPAHSTADHPDVVTILSESFTDLPRRIFNKPFTCLVPGVLSELSTPAWGGFTSNVEFELLTGYPHAIFPVGSVPYQMYLKRPIPNSLPNEFVRNGYETSAIHTFLRSFFSRPSAYAVLGIEKYDGIENFKAPIYRGQYVSDQVIFDDILHRLEPSARKPRFIHAVTMMAHLPYSWRGRYPVQKDLDERLPVSLNRYRLSLVQYGSMIYDHETMLCAFLDQLKKRKGRTVVLFYGDHYPSFGALDVYKDIHEQLHHERPVPFDLYAQYSRTPLFLFDSKVGFVKLPRVVPSYNLGTLLLEHAGLPASSIWAMPHKHNNRAIVSGIYVADNQKSKPLGREPGGEDPELEVLKAHAYKHLLSPTNSRD